LDDNPTGTGSDVYTIGVTLTDDDTGTATGSTTTTISNVAPVLDGLSATSAGENGVVHLTGTYHDAGTLDTHTLTINWGEGLPETVAVAGGSFDITHQYLDDNPTGTGSDVYTIGVTLTDDDTGTATGSTTTTISNVAPVIDSLAVNPAVGAVEGQTVSITAGFSDAGRLDTHSALIDWGDGTASSGIVNETDGSGTASASHVYAKGGLYTVSVSVYDDDGASAARSTEVLVAGVTLENGILRVTGTDLADTVVIDQRGRTSLRVSAGFLPGGAKDFPLAGVNTILAHLYGGNDSVQISGRLVIRAVIDGGAGNDRISGGAGHEILIGGTGADVLLANSGNDILIGGTTLFDNNDAALLLILAEWSSSRQYNVRVQNIRDGAGPILAGTDCQFRKGTTVFDDGQLDQLTGGAGQDWFFFDAAEDQVLDRKKNEAAN
jgi:Ca2+-binding RTX toxin-like protein